MARIRRAAALAFTVYAAVGMAACSSDPAAEAVPGGKAVPAEQMSPSRISVAEFASLVAKPGVQIIDVRTPQEFADGHIERAKNIPVQQPDFAERIAQLDPNGVYAVYCRSGNRSQSAVAQMNAAGITTIFELADGTNGWTADGQPLTR